MPRWLKPAVFLVALLPLVVMLGQALSNGLGPDPAEALMHGTGEWAARLLMLTLLVSPLRQWLSLPHLIQLRRMLGLFVFFYACLHLVLFLHFYLGWDGARVLKELLERPYISVGSLAWLILLPLAITSNRALQRAMGRLWLRLHRGVYLVAVLVSLHIFWQARSDYGEALLYVLAFCGLLAWRLIRLRRKHGTASNL
jgi:sulfoxide reductase heme-binding subunit YedZ